ncbi:potassium transporter-domain-containing protein [Leptodontidium sp. 2 PMI_412]|nr:potassium transporter-domain-containing protein [Leptodontidium sp. 2 PMI_412]
MAESTLVQRLQFEDGIHPIKTAGSRAYSISSKEHPLPEKAGGYDLEERAVQITNDDLNRKKNLTLTLMVSIKYMFIVLAADDDGEGGTFVLYSLLARYAHIVRRDPNTSRTVKMDRHLTAELKPVNKGVRNFIENSAAARVTLKILGVVGVSIVMADGVLTPAQSVLGAVQGLRVADPDITTPTIIGVSCAILVLLFAIQPLGTTKIASTFAPNVIIWLLFNMCCGIYNLATFDHSVLKAFSPYFAGSYLVRNKEEGWRALGGLLLAFTGVEALFVDLGAFSKRAIQISWLCFAYPYLLLAYIGQAALDFQLLSQVMNMSYFPHIKTVHTSKLFHGQLYIPMANSLLMIGCVVVTAVYSDTTRLGNAYGVCVIFVTFITTCLVSLVAIIIWRINILIVLLFFLVFGLLDGVYFSSALTKVPTGAWFTLPLSGILSTIFVLWRYGKESQWASEGEDPNLTAAFGGGTISKVNGVGIFFDKVGDMVPIVFAQFVRKFSARPEIIVFFHLRPLSVPSIPESERYVTQRTSIQGCYRMTVRHGYMDSIVSPDLGRLIVEQLMLFTTRDTLSSLSSSSSVEHTPEVKAELDIINRAAEAQMIKKGTNIVRKLLLMAFLWVRENSRTKMADINIPFDNLVEVGFVKEI